MTFKEIVIALIWVACPFIAKAEPFAWAHIANDSGARKGAEMAIDEKKNIYIVGNLEGDAVFGGNKISGSGSFLVKYDNNGTAIWAMALNGLSCKGVSVNVAGFLFVTGSFSGKVNVGKYSFTSIGGLDIFLLKLDSSGNILWVRQGGGLGNDIAWAVANDFWGNTFITGSFEESMNLDSQTNLLSLGMGDAFVAQYDSDGVVKWAQKEGGSEQDAGNAIAVDLQGNVYMAGRFSGTVDFYQQEATSKGGFDIFIARYNNSGFRTGLQLAGGPGDDVPTAMGLDGSAEIFLAGVFNGAADFGGRLISSKNKDAFLAFYDENMNPIWAKNMGGANDDAATGVAVDGQTNAYVTGVFSGTAGFGGDSLTSQGSTDIFVAKYDAAGKYLWSLDAGGTQADSTCAICLDHNDTAYLTGNIEGKSYFGNIVLNVGENSSFFISKLNDDPTLSIKSFQQCPLLNARPNPSGGSFYIEADALKTSIKSWTVLDITGTIIKKSSTIGNFSTNEINLMAEPAGIYFLMAFTDSGTFITKLVKE